MQLLLRSNILMLVLPLLVTEVYCPKPYTLLRNCQRTGANYQKKNKKQKEKK